jgi:hypothetical protein
MEYAIGVCVIVADASTGREHMEILNPAMIEKIATNEIADTE